MGLDERLEVLRAEPEKAAYLHERETAVPGHLADHLLGAAEALGGIGGGDEVVGSRHRYLPVSLSPHMGLLNYLPKKCVLGTPPTARRRCRFPVGSPTVSEMNAERGQRQGCHRGIAEGLWESDHKGAAAPIWFVLGSQ